MRPGQPVPGAGCRPAQPLPPLDDLHTADSSDMDTQFEQDKKQEISAPLRVIFLVGLLTLEYNQRGR